MPSNAHPPLSDPPAKTDNIPETPSVPRMIDESTDMSTLTDQEIMRLMEGMDHQDAIVDKVNIKLLCSHLLELMHLDSH
jgi:hypothetical protein